MLKQTKKLLTATLLLLLLIIACGLPVLAGKVTPNATVGIANDMVDAANSSSAISASNLNALFYKANSFYEAGDFKQAAKTYEQIINSGYISGNLFYNLGNAYFRVGEKGLALLNYVRAKAMMPRDPDLRSNLAYLQNDLQLKDSSGGFFKWLGTGMQDMASISEYLVGTEVILTLATLLLFLWLISPQLKRYLKIPLLVSVACLVLLLTATGVSFFGNNAKQAVVVKGETIARFEPTSNGGAYYTLKEGSSVVVDSTREGWVLVRRTDGKKGWVPEEDIKPFKIW